MNGVRRGLCFKMEVCESNLGSGEVVSGERNKLKIRK